MISRGRRCVPMLPLLVAAVVCCACGSQVHTHATRGAVEGTVQSFDVDPDEAVLEAIEHLGDGHIHKARGLLELVVGPEGMEPEHREGNLTLAAMLAGDGNMQVRREAIEGSLGRALEPMALANDPVSAEANAHFAAALEHLQRVLNQNPDDVQALLQQADVRLSQRELDQASAALDRTLQAHEHAQSEPPTHAQQAVFARIHTLYGFTLLARRDLVAAEDHFKAAQKRVPGYTPAVLGKGLIAYHLQDYETALTLGYAVFNANPATVEGRMLVTQTYLAMGKVLEPETFLQSIVADYPGDPEAAFNLAVFYQVHLQDAAMALHYYRSMEALPVLASSLELAHAQIDVLQDVMQATAQVESERQAAANKLRKQVTDTTDKVVRNEAREERFGDHFPDLEPARVQKRRVTRDVRLPNHDGSPAYQPLAPVEPPNRVVITGTAGPEQSFDDLDHVAGSLVILADPDLTEVRLPMLRRVDGNIEIIGNDRLRTVDLSALKSVGGSVQISENMRLEEVPLGTLLHIDGNTTIGNNPVLVRMDISSLEAVGGHLAITDNPQLSECSLRQLAQVGTHLELAGNSILEDFSVPMLTDIGGDVLIMDNVALVNVTFRGLKAVHGDLAIALNDTLKSVDAKSLKTVGGEVSVEDNPVLSEETLPKRLR